MTAYAVVRPPRHQVVQLRGLRMHLTRWGPPPSAADPPVLLLHGWMDAGATFQFLVDTFERNRPVVALDWRGFGQSEWPRDGYWFPDYLADLDALLDALWPHEPVQLIGHSMGGNIANTYAGIRPERVRCVVNLEGIGLARTSPNETAARLSQWLDQLKASRSGKVYQSFEQLAGIIRFRYPRFSAAQADFVAEAWGKLESDGRVRLAADPRHHWVNPVLYKREDAEACWRAVRAPLLMLVGEESEHLAKLGADGEVSAFRSLFPSMEWASIAGAGHMLHIERPNLVAPLAETFMDAH